MTEQVREKGIIPYTSDESVDSKVIITILSTVALKALQNSQVGFQVDKDFV